MSINVRSAYMTVIKEDILEKIAGNNRVYRKTRIELS